MMFLRWRCFKFRSFCRVCRVLWKVFPLLEQQSLNRGCHAPFQDWLANIIISLFGYWIHTSPGTILIFRQLSWGKGHLRSYLYIFTYCKLRHLVLQLTFEVWSGMKIVLPHMLTAWQTSSIKVAAFPDKFTAGQIEGLHFLLSAT